MKNIFDALIPRSVFIV